MLLDYFKYVLVLGAMFLFLLVLSLLCGCDGNIDIEVRDTSVGAMRVYEMAYRVYKEDMNKAVGIYWNSELGDPNSFSNFSARYDRIVREFNERTK